MEAAHASPLVSSLGEGPLWDPRVSRLYWVDIEGRALNWRDAGGAEHRANLPGMPGTVVLGTDPGVVVLALDSGVARFTVEGQRTEILAPFPGGPELRFNDGKAGPDGALWVGTMHRDAEARAGSLWRWTGPGQGEEVLPGVTIPNGLAWTADGGTLYFIDSPSRVVRAFDVEEGLMVNGRVVVRIPADWGWPDGMTIDDAGRLWIAHWAGHSVACYDPSTGQPVERIEVPAPFVTSCAFGGPGLRTLYITTAKGSSDGGWADLEKFPLSGQLFACEPGVEGLAEPTLSAAW